jgi:predicted Rossmann-fold nucleotide-binding protein
MGASQALKHGGYRVLVCGGRDYTDALTVYKALDRIAGKHGVVCLISGCATGADTLGIEWAESRGLPIARFPVTRGEWKTLGKSAGHIRNARMLAEGVPDICVAFPGGRGTADMISKCRTRGVLVWDPTTNEVT